MERPSATTRNGELFEGLPDSSMAKDHSLGLNVVATASLGAFDSDFLLAGDMELDMSPMEDEPLKLNACGLVSCGESHKDGQVDDLDMNFLSDLLPSESCVIAPQLNKSSSSADSTSSDTVETGSSGEDTIVRERDQPDKGRQKRAKKSVSTDSNSSSASMEVEPEPEGQVVDRKARRRAQVASSARRLRCRKKYEMMTLKTEASVLEKQLDGLRAKHKQMRANGAVAAWEEKAIAQRHKRRQAEQMNEQLRNALFMQSGFVRNLRSMFSESMPCSIELNMRNFLHTPTRLLRDPDSRLRSLEVVCTEAKLDLANRIILEETGGITAFTSPHISCRQIDLGAGCFGMTTVAVYALETKNACKAFKAASSAVINCATVWPNYSMLTSSLKLVNLPPTKLNIRYGINHQVYQSDTTGDQVQVETREVSYGKWANNSGVFLWDYVDTDDEYPLREDTTAMRCAIGAVLVRPEICTDGVERIVCRNLCTKVHMRDTPAVTPVLERFSKSRQLSARICGSLVYETIKNDTASLPDCYPGH